MSGERKRACRGGSAALHSHLELRKFKIYKRKCYENVTWARISVRRVTHNSWLVLQRLSRGKVAYLGKSGGRAWGEQGALLLASVGHAVQVNSVKGPKNSALHFRWGLLCMY